MKVKFNKTVLTNILKSNGYKVLNVCIYEDGTQAEVTVVSDWGQFKQYVIPRYELTTLEENAKSFKCYFQLFGLDKFFETKLFL